MKKCISCGELYKAEEMLTIVVDPTNIKKRINASPICESCYDRAGIGTLRKSFEPYSSYLFSIPDVKTRERELVEGRRPEQTDSDESTLKLLEERDALKEKIRVGGSFDLQAAAARLSLLEQMISLKGAFRKPLLGSIG